MKTLVTLAALVAFLATCQTPVAVEPDPEEQDPPPPVDLSGTRLLVEFRWADPQMTWYADTMLIVIRRDSADWLSGMYRMRDEQLRGMMFGNVHSGTGVDDRWRFHFHPVATHIWFEEYFNHCRPPRPLAEYESQILAGTLTLICHVPVYVLEVFPAES
jgi:hypothetical protein